jgi:hypothetical protein
MNNLILKRMNNLRIKNTFFILNTLFLKDMLSFYKHIHKKKFDDVLSEMKKIIKINKIKMKLFKDMFFYNDFFFNDIYRRNYDKVLLAMMYNYYL